MPVNIVTDAAHWLRRKFGLSGGVHFPRGIRYWILAATIIVAFAGGTNLDPQKDELVVTYVPCIRMSDALDAYDGRTLSAEDEKQYSRMIAKRSRPTRTQ